MSLLFPNECDEPDRECPSPTLSLGPGRAEVPSSRGRWRRLVPGRRWVCLAALVGVVTLAALYVPPMVRRVHRGRCAEQLKSVGAALLGYHQAHEHFPAAAITDRRGKPLLSWRVALLPQLGYQSLYNQFHLGEPWDSPHNLALLSRMPAVYACPSLADRRSFVTGYQAVVGPKPTLGGVGTMFEWARGVEVREVTDGTSNTLMVVETDRAVPWTRPDDLRFERDGPLPRFGSGHPGGFHVILADGTTRFLKSSISVLTLRALLTRDGGEVIAA